MFISAKQSWYWILGTTLLSVALLSIYGCTRPASAAPPQTAISGKKAYDIKLYRPDGELHRHWVIKTAYKPGITFARGGQTLIEAPGNEHLSVRMYAPVSWYLEIGERQQ